MMTDHTAMINTALAQIDQMIVTLSNLRAFISGLLPEITPLPAPLPAVCLPIPWISQLGPNASYAGGDCSMTCVAMILHSLGQNVTVDEVSRRAGLKAGFTEAAWWDAVKAAGVFGLKLEHAFNLEIAALEAEIRAGRPVITIINYRSLPPDARYSRTYNAGHFVLVVGFTADRIVIHDLFWPEESKAGAYVRIPRADFHSAWTTPAPGNTLSRQALRIKA